MLYRFIANDAQTLKGIDQQFLFIFHIDIDKAELEGLFNQ